MYMAMRETISSTGPGDSWPQFYQHNNSEQAQAPSGRTTMVTTFGDRTSDTTVVTTTLSSSSSAPSPHGSSTMNPSAAGHLNPEGRVSKPIRRQSRASRRTPTTLLNTDPTNFRAMVQQFTGGPSAPFPTGSHPSGPANFNFELGTRPNPTAVMVPSGAYHDLQYFHHQQQQQQQQQQQYRHQQILFPLNGRTTNHGHGDGFLQSLANSRPTLEMDVPASGFAMERGISYHAPPRPPS